MLIVNAKLSTLINNSKFQATNLLKFKKLSKFRRKVLEDCARKGFYKNGNQLLAVNMGRIEFNGKLDMTFDDLFNPNDPNGPIDIVKDKFLTLTQQRKADDASYKRHYIKLAKNGYERAIRICQQNGWNI